MKKPKKKKKQKQKKKQKASVTRERKSKKKQKKLEMLKEVGQFCSNIFPTFYSNFLSNLERLYFEGGGGEKTCWPHHFSLPLPFQPNTLPLIFFPILHSFFFHPPENAPNQTYPKGITLPVIEI